MSNIVFDIETTGLNSMESRVTCISMLDLTSDNVTTFIGEDEKHILESFWNSVTENDTLIGYNSHSFDMPFLIRRSVINTVRIKKVNKHIDIMKEVNSFFISYDKMCRGSLDDWAFVLTGVHKLDNGTQCIQYFLNKQFDELKKHCEQDVKVTKILVLRCKECNVI
jgi:uncharacterized protein YprB with RNaseH-like and TPR domain